MGCRPHPVGLSCRLIWTLFFCLFTLANGFRYGEAPHPGPLEADSSVLRFAVGTANVAGLSNKLDTLDVLPPGVWTLSETHLTDDGIKCARSMIAGRNTRSLYGAPAPPRTLDSHAGAWTGVATVSDFPCAVVPVDWSPGVFTSGPTLISSHNVGPLHLVVGSLYGVAQSPSHRDPLGATRLLLQSLVPELDHCRGPRVLRGDFNCDLLQFPELVHLRDQGWQELQIHALNVHQKPVECTCKRSTTRDFVWCSPELLCFYDCTAVHHDWFPDHSAVCGHFCVPTLAVETRFWPLPKPLPWNHVRHAEWKAAVDSTWEPFQWTSNTTKDFTCWSSQVGSSLSSFVATPHGRLPPGTGGRGQTLTWKKGIPSQPSARPSRAGEVVMQCAFPTRGLVRWYRQLRRLQSLLRSCRKGTLTHAAGSYQTLCWSAVMRAPGFHLALEFGGLVALFVFKPPLQLCMGCLCWTTLNSFMKIFR